MRIFCVALAILACQVPFSSASYQPLDRIVAVVENEVILKSELDRQVSEFMKLQQNRLVAPTPAIEKQMLSKLVKDALQLQLAERAGITVDDTMVTAALTRMAQKQGATLSEMQAGLKDEGVSYEAFRNDIQKQLTINEIRRRVVSSRIDISERELEAYLASSEGQRHKQTDYLIRHIFVKLPEAPTWEERDIIQQKAQSVYRKLQEGEDFSLLAQAYSESNTALSGGNLGWKSSEQLPATFKSALAPLQPGENTAIIPTPSGYHILKVEDRRGHQTVVQKQYQVRQILIAENEVRNAEAAKILAFKIFQNLKKGENFTTLAKAWSDDANSKLEGGHESWIAPDQLDPLTRTIVLNAEKSDVQTPFKSKYGWHIVEVLDEREADLTNEMVERQAKDVLFQRKFALEMENWLQEIEGNSYIDIRL